MVTRLLTAPPVEPITYLELEAQIRATLDTVEYPLVNAMISAARQQAENITRRALITQTWEVSLDRFPCGKIILPFPPIQSVTSVTYLDGDGVSTVLDPALYTLETDEPAYLLPVWGQSWPTARNYPGSVKIVIVCGYGPAPYDVTAIYESGDRCLYTDGKMYSCSQTTTAGTLPTDTDYFSVTTIATEVPEVIRQWMLIKVADMYENRESIVIGSINSNLGFVDELLTPYRVLSF